MTARFKLHPLATVFALLGFVLLPVRAQITGTAPNFSMITGTETDGTYTLSSSTLAHSGGTLNVGTFTLMGNSAYNLSNGGTANFSSLQIGFQFNSSTASNSSVNQSGGTLTVSGNVQVGNSGALGTGNGVTSTYNLSGGSLIANSVTLSQVNGYATSGTFNLNGTSTSGGTLTTSSILKGSSGSGVYLNFNGGTLRAGPSDNFNWINGSITTRISTNGATIDTNGRTMGIYAALLHDPNLGAVLDGGLTKTGAGTLTLYNNNTYSGATTLKGGTLSIGSYASIGTATNAINFLGGILQIKLQDGQTDGTQPQNFGSHTINAATFNGGLDIADGTNTFTLSQSLSGAGAMTKLGAGTLILGGTNSYAGGTAINGGYLQAGTASALGSGPVTFGGGTLRYGSGLTTDFSALFSTGAGQQYSIDTNGQDVTFASALTSSGGSFAKAGSGTLTLTGVNTYAGGTTVTGGTLKLTTFGAIRGALTIGSGATVEAAVVNALGNVAGAKVDSITIDGGTLNHSAASNNGWGVAYTLSNGGLLMSNGGVSDPGASSAFSFGGPNGSNTSVNVTAGTNTIAGHVDFRGENGNPNVNFTVADGATLNVTAGISSHTGGVVGDVGFTKLGAGTMTLTGANTYAGTTAINGGTLQAGNAAALGSGPVTFGGGTIQYGPGITTDFSARFSTGSGQQYSIDTNGQDVTFASALTSSGGTLAKAGAGTLTLTGTNTYTGGTTVTGGTLQIGAGGATGSIAGNVVNHAGLVFNRSDSLGFGGVISGSGSVAQIGAGDLTLTGANTYTGATTVSAGRLIVNGSLANTALSVESGATLAGAGTIGGPATFLSGAILAPGNSPGTLTFTNGLTLNDGTILNFDLGTSSDLIRVSGGTLTGPASPGGITLNLTDSGDFAANTYVLFDFTGADASGFDASSFTLGSSIPGYDYSFVLNGSTLELVAATTPVPEPATYAVLAGLGALGLVLVRRRYR